MSRLHLRFGCGSLKLAGTLDTAPGTIGLLIVSGGNEIRSGAFCSQSHLALCIARAGFPVFRFDRRGIGDSEGENRGFLSSAGDIRAALEAFRAMAPRVERVVAFGNCDAASALMLSGGEGFDGLILSNPWTVESTSEDAHDGSAPEQPQHAPKAIRSRYVQKLKDPREIARLLRGGVNLKKLARGLASSLRPSPPPSGLVERMAGKIAQFDGSVEHFSWQARIAPHNCFRVFGKRTKTHTSKCEGAGHAYVEPEHRAWLEERILAALRS